MLDPFKMVLLNMSIICFLVSNFRLTRTTVTFFSSQSSENALVGHLSVHKGPVSCIFFLFMQNSVAKYCFC